jgi:prepilin-type N-terminal cleavage/methylation domain-containing protein
MLANDRGPGTRRGVTLIEMLVTLAILLIIMTILVQIFQAATGAVSAAQAYQQLDDQLRRIDGMIRGDLEGVTARFTPPLNPTQNLGYFEYIENEFADSQGEDSDDCIRFTTKAPPNRPFTGRLWVSPTASSYNAAAMPITITSEYAEIIYFLRNGNLYRRVLLIAPERRSSIVQAASTLPAGPFNVGYYNLNGNTQTFTFTPNALSNDQVSWLGVNDLSARPAVRGGQSIILNTLGDLTNRENRFAAPRFADDFYTIVATQKGTAPTWTIGPDGLSDDQNDDNVPDLYTTLYPSVFNTGLIWAPPNYPNTAVTSHLAFPYIFPGAYSQSQDLPTASYSLGWIHSPTPTVVDASGNPQQMDGTNPLSYLQYLNHNPLDLGDNLPPPAQSFKNMKATSNWQTWWGFPTWRETLSSGWVDPTVQVNIIGSNQPIGLVPLTTGEVSQGYVNATTRTLLPPMSAAWRVNPQPFTDGFGSNLNTSSSASATALWNASWEDDLIMTGVRSFDVKAYDNALGSFADLGWGDDLRTSGFTGVPFLAGNPDYSGNFRYPPLVAVQGRFVDYINTTFAHEGRMPPLFEDNRLDAQFPNPSYTLTKNPLQPTWIQQYPNISVTGTTGTAETYNFSTYSSNIGDDQTIVRLRRVWDSWSTNYSNAPATGVYNNYQNPSNYTANPPVQGDPLNASPWGPPYTPPIYPSYPPPYPAPLRGIQIQIRVVDPTNQRVKSLTIRQDFTDKL